MRIAVPFGIPASSKHQAEPAEVVKCNAGYARYINKLSYIQRLPHREGDPDIEHGTLKFGYAALPGVHVGRVYRLLTTSAWT